MDAKPIPTGRLLSTADGHELVLTRTFKAAVTDIWADVTEPGRTALWFGPWEGDAGVGHIIRVRLDFEDGTPWCDLRIDACEPPYLLGVTMSDAAGDWPMELRLSEADGVTRLELVHRLATTKSIGDIGPGWEYYLDRLCAARDGSETVSFEAYYPAQKEYFESLAVER
ncbi:SRPBCC family protein [Streptomyces sp. A7024]|uniref:SRPBCC family protein n=1 Tax=Streptomyces coryli TaxID=1128680 RepID=A0A6G4UAH9_9ACTN|nr:SRPBCC family protein [Streptomyces coryli]NGN68720.1 SRPBCC family protein [Streptomyces coryli]